MLCPRCARAVRALCENAPWVCQAVCQGLVGVVTGPRAQKRPLHRPHRLLDTLHGPQDASPPPSNPSPKSEMRNVKFKRHRDSVLSAKLQDIEKEVSLSHRLLPSVREGHWFLLRGRSGVPRSPVEVACSGCGFEVLRTVWYSRCVEGVMVVGGGGWSGGWGDIAEGVNSGHLHGRVSRTAPRTVRAIGFWQILVTAKRAVCGSQGLSLASIVGVHLSTPRVSNHTTTLQKGSCVQFGSSSLSPIFFFDEGCKLIC